MKRLLLKISLRDVNPQVCRRIIVNPKLELSEFHFVLQVTMRWSNSHLHGFIKGRKTYFPPDIYDTDEFGYIDYSGMKVSDLLKKVGDKIVYLYDFGDSWEHDIVVEAKLDSTKDAPYVEYVDGSGACPPEDCGGAPGYKYLLEAINDPTHEEYESFREWMGLEDDKKYNPNKTGIVASTYNAAFRRSFPNPLSLPKRKMWVKDV